MMRFVVIALMILVAGCTQNRFNVPKENFAQKVRVLGIIPIIVDSGSDIKHPLKDQIISLLAETNRKLERPFVRKIKETGSFFTVAMLDVDPQATFESLLFRREKRDDAAIQYNKYFWKENELSDLMRRNNIDAVMFVVLSGITRPDKVSGPGMLNSRAADYNFIIMTSQIVDSKGVVLWEYPNFRTKILSYDPMFNLQYPDFSEAEANLLKQPEVKFKSLEGIKRALEKRRKDILARDTQEVDIYYRQFDEIINLIKFSPEDVRKESGDEDLVIAPKEPATKPQEKNSPPPEPAVIPQPPAQPAPAATPSEPPQKL